VTLAVIRAGLDSDQEIEVAWLARKLQIDVQQPSKQDGRKEDVFLDGEDVTWAIREPQVDALVSKISAYAEVREAMIDQQRRIGRRGQVVMVGRDIGTVVMPDADLKIYLEASLEERAKRRYKEILMRGEDADFDQVLAALRNRDTIDSSRAVAPLKPAGDAIIIVADQLTVEQVLEKIRNHCGEYQNERESQG
jgi:cytidylate kinase